VRSLESLPFPYASRRLNDQLRDFDPLAEQPGRATT
jgi:hypothetical protein